MGKRFNLSIALALMKWLLIMSSFISLAWIDSTQAAKPIMPEVYLKGELPALPSEFLVKKPDVPLSVIQETCATLGTQALATNSASAGTLIKIQPNIFPLISEDFLPSPILPD